MPAIEIMIGSQKYELKGQDNEEHLREVSEIVKRRVETLRKKQPSLTLQKATMLAALDFASDLIKSKKRSTEFRGSVLAKTQFILDKVETELGSAS